MRPGIADPQGATIERALPALGFEQVSGVRAGKAFRFVLDAADEAVGAGRGRAAVPAPAGQPGDRGLGGDHARRGGAVTARVGVVLFPGSNCEHDVVEALDTARRARPRSSGTATASLGSVDAVVLPGGFAHGDYLRPGAIARFSPIMAAVADFAAAGGPVVGICNGFQVLTEAHLLPGALQKNRGLTFLCKTVELEVASDRSVLTPGSPLGTRLRIPINHFEGNYTATPPPLPSCTARRRIVLRYVDNPNGSVDDIAGICNEAGNVVGLMPHPERASDALLGSTDGQALLRALLAAAGDASATAPSSGAPGSRAPAAPGRPGAPSVSS